MPDPFLVIVAAIAVVCVLLYPVRLWRKRHHRYGNDADADDG
jgi:fatty acid desaturase